MGENIQARRAEVKRLVAAGHRNGMIASELGVSEQTVVSDKRALGLTRAYGAKERNGAADIKRAERAQRGAKTVSDRRRFKTVPVPMGSPSVMASAEVCSEGRTMFPDRVFLPPGPGQEPVLKDGSNNSKIGGDVLVGRLRGAYICTLTLQERATCPSTCSMWASCYGNAMPWARRWAAGTELEDSLRVEVSEACAANDLVLIRLHVLGDFYSFDYLKLWAELLDAHDGLHVFGFTAWGEGTQIGDGVARLRAAYPERFMIRHSGRTGRWGSFTLPFPTSAKTIGDAIVCPEQLDGMRGSPKGRHCGNCAACWSTDRPIAFVEH